MNQIIAIVVFAILLGIALIGLAISNRQARTTNASRQPDGSRLQAHDLPTGRAAPPDRRQDRI